MTATKRKRKRKPCLRSDRWANALAQVHERRADINLLTYKADREQWYTISPD